MAATASTAQTPPPGAPGGTRSARAELTRARILDAARTLFVERGYRATSLRDVAGAAGISHPGLRRHYGSTDQLLAEVVAAFETENDALPPAGEGGAELPFAAVAARNERMPGYLELFAALSGEACARTHPAHGPMAERYERLRELTTRSMRGHAAAGVVHADRDPRDESIRISAAWDGLQVMRLYLPDRVDVAAALATHAEHLRRAPRWVDAATAPRREPGTVVEARWTLVPGAAAQPEGYRVGRRRRERIVADAMALFASQGYTGTSLRDIASAVGTSKSALLHHYPTKDDLLRAVLLERDTRISITAETGAEADAASQLRAMSAGASYNAQSEPGLIELYAVLSCEAIPADHPAHGYFRDRFGRAIDGIAELFRVAQADGILSAHRDPVAEAIWLLALWDGLQYQWLYDGDAVDVAAHLTAHLADVLP